MEPAAEEFQPETSEAQRPLETSSEMKYVEPFSLFRHLNGPHTNYILLGLYIGPHTVTAAISDAFLTHPPSIVCSYQKSSSIHSFADDYQALLKDYGFQCIVIGHYNDTYSTEFCHGPNGKFYSTEFCLGQSLEVMTYVQYLSRTGKFKNVKYTHWKSGVSPKLLEGTCSVVIAENAACLLQSYLDQMYNTYHSPSSSMQTALSNSVSIELGGLALNSSDQEMNYVEPFSLFDDLNCDSSSRKRLLGLFLGDRYVATAISEDDLTASPLCSYPKILTMDSIAEKLRTLVELHEIGGIVIGNCFNIFSTEFAPGREVCNEESLEVRRFVRGLSGTGKFKNVKYTYWNTILARKLLKAAFAISKAPNIQKIEVVAAFGVLQSYLECVSDDSI